MATARKIYRGGLVEGVAVPTVDFSQYKVMSSGWASLNQKIDGITNFAVKHLDVQMADEGKQYAAENPVSLEQFYKANPTDRENLLGGNKTTTFGKAIRATHISILSSDMSIKAQKDFMDLDWEAETLALKGTPMNLDLYKSRLDAIVNGYSDALLDVDAEASLVAKAKLATTANSYYTSYADTLITDYKKKTIAQAMWAGNAHINNRIKKIIALGSEVEIPGADGKPVKISIDDYLAAEKIRIAQELLNSNVSVEQLTKWSAAWDAEVVQQKKNWLFANYVDIDENYNKSVAHQQLIWDEVRKGTFSIKPQPVIYPPGADQETIAAIDAKAAKDASTQSKRFQAMYNSLSEKEQREFRGKVKEWAGNALDQAENEEKAITIDKAKTVEDLKFKYQISLEENNYEAAKEIVEELKTIDKETYIDLSKELKEDKTKGEFNDEEVYDALYEYLWNGTLTEEAINLTYDRGLINWDTKKDLKTKRLLSKKDGFEFAKEHIKRKVNYVPYTQFETGAATKNREGLIAFNTKVDELLTWMKANPNVTKEMIIEKGYEITQEHDTSNQNEANIVRMQKKMTSAFYKNEKDRRVPGHDLGSWTAYFSGEWQEKEPWYSATYQHKKMKETFLNSPEGVDYLIQELEQVKNFISSGGYLIEDKPLERWDVNILDKIPKKVRNNPLLITNMIADLRELKGYLQ